MGVRDVVKRIPGARATARVLRSLRSRVSRKAEASLRYSDRPKNFAVILDLSKLTLSNRFSRRSLIDEESPLVVSTTTHGRRLARVHLAIESVGRGELRPKRHILWLDDPALYMRRPATIRRLERRGLEVRLVDPGLKVHTKYWPYVDALDEHASSLVVCDDDIIYPRTWLAGLAAVAESHPGHIVAYRTHTIRVEGDAIAPYATWEPTLIASSSFRHFPTAVSGTLYPAELLAVSKRRGLAFLTESPMNDDVWLHALAVDHGIKTVQVSDYPQHFPFVPGTQDSGLYMSNIGGGENDRQIARSYSRDAVARILADRRESGS